MPRIALTLIATLFIFSSFSQEIIEKKVESKINKVTVFLTGGEVQRNATVSIKKGRNKLIFTGISTVADNKSVQFKADKAYNLVSVSSEVDYLSFAEENKKITTLKDSLELLQHKRTNLQNEKTAYQDEQALLKKNNDIKGSQENLSVEELQSMANFYRTRLMELYKINAKYDEDIQALNTTIYRYQNQLTELNYRETIKSNQIIVIIDSEENTEMNVELKYVVSNCGWQANYDLKATNVKDNIHLKYKAKVFNNTGNDWKNVNLVLSTSDPNISASAPNLTPWYLNQNSFNSGDELNQRQTGGYVVPQNRAYTKYYDNASAPQMNQNLDGFGEFNGLVSNANVWSPNTQTVNFTTIQVSQLSTEFVIDKAYSIPSDSKPYLVDIAQHSLAATYTHKAVPKLDKDVFLLANIVGWEKLDLVPGPTQVYFDDTYVGQSYMNTANVSDTLRLSFGRDKKIVVERKLLEEFSDKKVVGSNRKDTYTYQITLKNNHSIPVSINLLDQIPISQDSDITITADEISEAIMNVDTGILKWMINLQPGESKIVKLGFTIKYSKDRNIQVKQYKTISCPSF